MKLVCDIYSSPHDSDMYLYVKKQDGLSRVPEALLQKFGKPCHAMTLLLQPQRKLARVDAARVIAQIEATGYFLQLPSAKDATMQEIHQHNSKL